VEPSPADHDRDREQQPEIPERAQEENTVEVVTKAGANRAVGACRGTMEQRR